MRDLHERVFRFLGTLALYLGISANKRESTLRVRGIDDTMLIDATRSPRNDIWCDAKQKKTSIPAQCGSVALARVWRHFSFRATALRERASLDTGHYVLFVHDFGPPLALGTQQRAKLEFTTTARGCRVTCSISLLFWVCMYQIGSYVGMHVTLNNYILHKNKLHHVKEHPDLPILHTWIL